MAVFRRSEDVAWEGYSRGAKALYPHLVRAEIAAKIKADSEAALKPKPQQGLLNDYERGFVSPLGGLMK
jgi:hypothetical protein